MFYNQVAADEKFCDNFSKDMLMKKDEWIVWRRTGASTQDFYLDQIAKSTAYTARKLDYLIQEMCDSLKIKGVYKPEIQTRKKTGITTMKQECQGEFLTEYVVTFDQIFYSKNNGLKRANDFCQRVIDRSYLPAGRTLHEIKKHILRNGIYKLKEFIIPTSVIAAADEVISPYDREAPTKLAAQLQKVINHLNGKYADAYNIILKCSEDLKRWKVVWGENEVKRYEKYHRKRLKEFWDKSLLLPNYAPNTIFPSYNSYMQRINAVSYEEFMELYGLVFRLTETVR